LSCLAEVHVRVLVLIRLVTRSGLCTWLKLTSGSTAERSTASTAIVQGSAALAHPWAHTKPSGASVGIARTAAESHAFDLAAPVSSQPESLVTRDTVLS